MNILVLGGTGFLGRFIVELLFRENIECTVLTRDLEKVKLFSKKINFIQADLLDLDELNLSSYTHIINCSGELKNKSIMHSLHVEAIARILNKLKQYSNHAHWIQISSVGVYGKVKKGVISENSVFAPIGEYEKTKAESELLVKRFCSENKIKYTIIRPSNVFGCGMPNQSIAQLISIIKRKLFIYIGKNTSKQVMNYVPVEDVAKLVLLCLKNENSINQEFNISDQLSLEDFVSLVCTELDIENKFPKVPELLVRFLAQICWFIPKAPLKPSRVDALTMRVNYSNKNAQELLDYRPAIGVRTAMKNYIASLIINNTA